MKRYTTKDESSGYISAQDDNLSLVGVYHITNWNDEQFDKISEMKVGEKLDFDGVTVERTK